MSEAICICYTYTLPSSKANNHNLGTGRSVGDDAAMGPRGQDMCSKWCLGHMDVIFELIAYKQYSRRLDSLTESP